MSNVKLSVAIMAHPIRDSLIDNLLERLGDDNIPVFMDYDSNGIWWNAMRAWRAYDPDATHHMVLQDDILVCNNLLRELPAVIEIAQSIREDASISLCDSLGNDAEVAEKIGANWIMSTKVKHGQALIQPVSQIEDFINWAEWHVRPEYYHDDGRLEIYLTVHGKRILHTLPSLVEHYDKGSVVSQKEKGFYEKENPYKSYRFIGENKSPLTVNWNTLYTKSVIPLNANMRWAIGHIPVRKPGFGRNMMNEKTSHLAYDDIMEDVRKERGLI